MAAATYRISGEDEGSVRYRGWRIAGASSVCILVSFGSLFIYTFGIFLKPLAGEFGWSRQAISVSFAIAALSVAAASPLIGWLLDRYPARRITIPATAIFGLAFGSLSLLTGHLWHLYAVSLIIGLVGNGAAHLAYSRVVATWFERHRGLAFSVLLGGSALGAMVLPPLAEALIAAVGWRASFAALGALVLVIGIPFASFVRERGGAVAERRDEAGWSVSASVRTRVFWILITELLVVSLSQNGSIAHLSALLTDRGISSQYAAMAVSSMGLAILAGRLVTGWLLDRCFAPYVAVALFAVSALGTFLLAGASSLLAGILAAALIGFGMGGEGDITPYLLSRYFGLRAFSTLYGFTWTAYAISAAVGPIIMGRAFDVTGSYRSLLTVLTFTTLVGGALFLLLPRYEGVGERE